MVLSTSRNLTILGIGTIVGAVGNALVAIFDGDPLTNVDWGLTFGLIVSGIGNIMAKGSRSSGGDVDANGVALAALKGLP